MKTALIAASAALALVLSAPAEAGPQMGAKDWGVTVGMSQGRLGAQVQNMTPELREFFGAPADAGILVAKVATDSAAAKAGLRVGDIVTKVAGQSVDQPWDVMSALAAKKKGEVVELVVVRGKKTQTLKATLTDDSFAFGGNVDARFGPRGLHVDPDFKMHMGDLDDFLGKDMSGVQALIKKLAPYLDGNALKEKLEKTERRLEELEKRLKALEKK